MKEKRGVIGASETAILPPVKRFKRSLAKCGSLGIILSGPEAFASFLSLLFFFFFWCVPVRAGQVHKSVQVRGG